MASVTERLREDDAAAVVALTIEQRIELALELGRRDLELFAATNNLQLSEAHARLRRNRQAGRRRCTVFDSPSR